MALFSRQKKDDNTNESIPFKQPSSRKNDDISELEKISQDFMVANLEAMQAEHDKRAKKFDSFPIDEEAPKEPQLISDQETQALLLEELAVSENLTKKELPSRVGNSIADVEDVATAEEIPIKEEIKELKKKETKKESSEIQISESKQYNVGNNFSHPTKTITNLQQDQQNTKYPQHLLNDLITDIVKQDIKKSKQL